MTTGIDPTFVADLEQVFDREWVAVGHVGQCREAGDFATLTIGTEPVVVLRNATGELRAHLNVCRHRGSQILRGEGRVKALKCPYHGWMYSLDGELRGAPEMKHSACFEKADYGLIGLAVAEWRGLVLLNFDPGAEFDAGRLEEVAGGLADFGEVELAQERVSRGWREAIAALRRESPEATVVGPNLVLLRDERRAFSFVLPVDAGTSTVVTGRPVAGSS